MQDMHDKGRHPGKKQDASTAARIRAEYVRGSKEFGQVALSKKYGFGQTTISRIIRGI